MRSVQKALVSEKGWAKPRQQVQKGPISGRKLSDPGELYCKMKVRSPEGRWEPKRKTVLSFQPTSVNPWARYPTDPKAVVRSICDVPPSLSLSILCFGKQIE